MQFIDLHKQYINLEYEIRSGIEAVLEHKKFIMGPEVFELEQKLENYTGRKHAITCSNGTDALVMSMMIYNLKKTDAVFVPSFTFYASAESITLAGGTPVFVDCDETFNICLHSLEKAIKKVKGKGDLTPKGIITVDLFGLPADYDRLQSIANKEGLFLIEDAAQGFGGVYKGRKACSFGDISTTSFFPAKPLGCYGDGGAVFTDDDDIAEMLKSIRVHGKGTDKYDNVRIGLNARLDTIQAVVLMKKLEIFDGELDARNRIAAEYTKQLSGITKTPIIPEGFLSAWAQYTITADDEKQRERIISGLKDKGIPTMIYYPTPIHLSTGYKYLGYNSGDLPVCENLSKRVFSIPMHPYLTNEEVMKVCDAIKIVM